LVLACATAIAESVPAGAQTGGAPTDARGCLASSLDICPAPAHETDPDPSAPVDSGSAIRKDESFHLGPAIGQAFGFTVFQHIVRLAEPHTRHELGGPFLQDWFTSVSRTGRTWDDGNRFFTNYIGHPMGGAVYAHIYRQNDFRRRDLAVGEPGYGGMVLRAMLFSALTSVQFELGPVSEASIGNIGMTRPRGTGWVDFVITPTLGAAWMVGEDVIDERLLTRMD
jgi:hypothetical protein